jgi:hypothetical protein
MGSKFTFILYLPLIKIAMLVFWLFESWAQVQLMRGFFSMLGMMLEATAWYWWSNFFSPSLGLNPPSRGLGTETPKALPMG